MKIWGSNEDFQVVTEYIRTTVETSSWATQGMLVDRSNKNLVQKTDYL